MPSQEQISQLIKDITADTESMSSPVQSPSGSFPWLQAAHGSDSASTVTLPSLAPPKPLVVGGDARSSSASPLDEFASSRTTARGMLSPFAPVLALVCACNTCHLVQMCDAVGLHADTVQVSPTLAGRLPQGRCRSTVDRSPSPTDSLPSMPAATPLTPLSHTSSEGLPASRSTSGWAGGRHSGSQMSLDGDGEPQQLDTGAEGPCGDSSTVKSMDEVLSSVMRGRPSWAGRDVRRSVSLQIDGDSSPGTTGRGDDRGNATPADSPASSQRYSKFHHRAAPFAVKTADSDQSFMSPLASSDTSMRAESTIATPADLRADVDSILCGSFWRS